MCFTLVSVYVHTVDLVTLTNILNSRNGFWKKRFQFALAARRQGVLQSSFNDCVLSVVLAQQLLRCSRSNEVPYSEQLPRMQQIECSSAVTHGVVRNRHTFTYTML
jgi:hypothetical protein